MKKARKLMGALISTMMVIVMMTPVTVKAATYENERFTVNVNKYGMATLTNKAEDMTYQLTKTMTTEEGAIDECDTVYLRLKGGSLYIYSPKYQKDKKLHLLEENVVKLIFDNDKRLQGYQIADGNSKSLLVENEVKKLVEKDENTTNDTNKVDQEENTNNSSNESTGSNYSDTSSNSNSDVFVSNQGNDNTTTVDNTATGSSGEKNNNVNVINKGNNNTTSVKNKTDTNPKDPNVNIINNGNGNTTTVINNVTTNNIVKKKTQKVVRNYGMRGKALYNSKGKKVDSFKLNKGKLTYHTVKTKNVKYAKFNEAGNLIYIVSKGKSVTINHITLKQKTIAKSGITKFGTTKRGLAKYIYRKNGTRIDVRKK